MEVEGAEKRMGTVFLYEVIGTALFIYGILLTYSPLSIAFSLGASIMLFGGITGGHFNPAVTLAVYIVEGKWMENLKWLGLLVLAQFLGGAVAMGLSELTLMNDNFGAIAPGNVQKLCPKDPLSAGEDVSCDGSNTANGFLLDFQVLFNEMVVTFVFITVILQFKGGANTQPSSDSLVGIMSICLTLLACIKASGQLGGCLNPAVGLTLGVNQVLHLGNENSVMSHYIYAFMLGPLLGSVASGLFFKHFHRDHFVPAGKGEKAQ